LIFVFNEGNISCCLFVGLNSICIGCKKYHVWSDLFLETTTSKHEQGQFSIQKIPCVVRFVLETTTSKHEQGQFSILFSVSLRARNHVAWLLNVDILLHFKDALSADDFFFSS
jgi:hypothetical protein